jgi:hypothetical protein
LVVELSPSTMTRLRTESARILTPNISDLEVIALGQRTPSLTGKQVPDRGSTCMDTHLVLVTCWLTCLIIIKGFGRSPCRSPCRRLLASVPSTRRTRVDHFKWSGSHDCMATVLRSHGRGSLNWSESLAKLLSGCSRSFRF